MCVFSSRPIVEAISKNCLIINTCGRKRSSTLNATCDPNIDLQFATASSLVKMGNRNLLCSEAMLKEYKWRTASVQIHPLLLSDVLIGSYVLTSRYSCPPQVPTLLRSVKQCSKTLPLKTVRCVTPLVLRVLRSPRNGQTEDSWRLNVNKQIKNRQHIQHCSPKHSIQVRKRDPCVSWKKCSRVSALRDSHERLQFPARITVYRITDYSFQPIKAYHVCIRIVIGYEKPKKAAMCRSHRLYKKFNWPSR